MHKLAIFRKCFRLYGGVLLLGGFAAVAAPAQAQVVINEVYGGGGNASAPFRNDFVELRNNGATAVDLTGFSVQYASNTGAFSTSNSVTLTGSIAPGGFYLVQFASGGAVGAALPTARATGTANISASNGKIALANNTTPVTFDNTANPDTFSANTLDFVGFGSGNAFEGTAAAPAGSNTASITRNLTGTDTNQNGTDFTVSTPPTPTDGGGNTGGPGSFQFSAGAFSITENGGSLTITVTRTGGATGAASVDFATTGGTATSGTDFTPAAGTLNFADGQTTATFTVTVLDDTIAEANETITLTLSNPTNGATVTTPNPATLTIRDNDRAAGLLLLNEIKKDAPTTTDAPSEYVELRGTPGTSLTNVSVIFVPGDSGFTASFGTARRVFDLSGQSIGSNGLLVIQSPTGPATSAGGTTIVTDTDFDAAGSGAFFDGSGTFLLVFSPTPITEGSDLDGPANTGTLILPADSMIIDSIGFLDGDTGDSSFGAPSLALPGATPEDVAPDAASRFPSNNTANSAGAFFFGELAGAANTSLDYDESVPGTTVSSNFPSGYDLTPGAANTLPGAPAATTGAILSEFRFRGATGTADEFVEIFNTLGTPLNISGWSIQTNTAINGGAGLQTTLVPANTTIPARGHFLFTGTGYSLSTYGAGNASITSDAADDSGVALFNAAGQVQDAVGFVSSASTLKEGAGLASAPNVNGEYAFLRDFNNSLPKDSGDSTNDFVFVATNASANFDQTAGSFGAPVTVAGTNGAVAAQLGAPSPEGLASPVYVNDQVTNSLLDPGVSQGAAPNRVRTGSGNDGTLVVRRTLKNNTNRALTRVRFMVTRITADGSALTAGQTRTSQAIIRLVSSSTENVVTSIGTIPVSGTTLEANAAGLPSEPLGGGLGSSVSFDAVLSTPLAPSGTAGDTRSYSFSFNIVKSGNFTAILNIEALPPQ